MDLVTIIKAILPVEAARLQKDPNTLLRGDRLLGQVLKIHNDGKVLMDFNAFRALTEIPIKVTQGQRLPLEVVDTGTPLKMRIIPSFVPSSDTVQQNLGEKSTPFLNSAVIKQLTEDLGILKNSLIESKFTLSIPVEANPPGQALPESKAIPSVLPDSKTTAMIPPESKNASLVSPESKTMPLVSPDPKTMPLVSPESKAIPQESPEPKAIPPVSPESKPTSLVPTEFNIREPVSEQAKSTLPIQSALENLRTLLSGMDINVDIKKLAQDIRVRIDDSGLFFEKKLENALTLESTSTLHTEAKGHTVAGNELIGRDFKPNALLMLKFLDYLEPQSNSLEETIKARIQNTLKEMLSDLGQQKETAFKRLAVDDPFQVFHLSLPFAQKDETAKLKLFYAKKHKDAPKSPPSVSLLLDLEHLGPVRSDLMLLKNDLSITFYVKDSDIKDFIDDRVQSLSKLLAHLFDSVTLNVRVSEKKIKSFNEPPSIQKSNHRVDLRI